jgi:hypothetical protein
MPNTLHLYGAGSDLTAATGHVGLLCEIAPDSRWLHGAQYCYRADEMLGSQDAALKVAHPLVCELIQSVSTIEDLPTLSIFEEPLLEQLSYIVQTFRLDRWISSKGFTECRFASYSPWLERLRQVREVTESKYALIRDLKFGQGNSVYRTIEKLWQSVGRPSELVRRIAPLWSRYWLTAWMRKPSALRGGIWFYSTAYNYTTIGLEYEPYFPEKMNFLVEDAATGGKRLRELGRDFHVLYAWARASDIPSASEVRSFGDRLLAAVLSIPLTDEQSVLRSVLLSGDWWHLFVKRWLFFALFHGRVLQRWCQSVAPEMVVVGNAGWERALLQYRGAERIPSVMLQHGIMHWVYAVADQPVTTFLLRGKFFQSLINEDLRLKTVICNYPQACGTTIPSKVNSRSNILFITTPYDVPALFHRGDLRDTLHSLLHVSHTRRRRLVIRVHPLERISSYQQLVSEIQKESGLDSDVAYSQGPGVEDLLAHSCVAVLYFSTMFLDCLRHGVPMVSFGWHWFPNKEHFEEAGVFNFASDLRNLEQLVQEAIEGKLSSRRDGLEDFLASSRPEEIAKVLREFWESRPA